MDVVLQTARLTLRQPTVDDFERSHALFADEDMRRHLVGRTYDREDSFVRVVRNAGCWSLFGYGPFSMFERATGDYVGGCGLYRGLRGLGDDFDPYPEALWFTGRESWGLGYASEAMTAALDWFDRAHGGRTVCVIAPSNTASERVAAKVGYAPIGLASYKDAGLMRYAREPYPASGRGRGPLPPAAGG